MKDIRDRMNNWELLQIDRAISKVPDMQTQAIIYQVSKLITCTIQPPKAVSTTKNSRAAQLRQSHVTRAVEGRVTRPDERGCFRIVLGVSLV